MIKKLTLPPLPSFPDIASAFIRIPSSKHDIAGPWLVKNQTAFIFSRSAWGLQALVITAQFKLGEKPIVWLPDYFCDDTLHPLRLIGARVQFYPITLNLAPDWDQCYALAQKQTPDLFVIVHYFGQPSEGVQAFDFCQKTGALLIEDAAHALSPSPGIGAYGDATFYSPHKHLPIPQGSLVVLKDRSRFLPSELETACRNMAEQAPSSANWLTKRTAQKMLPPKILRAITKRNQKSFLEDGASKTLPTEPLCSRFGKTMLEQASKNLKKCSETRRKNWRYVTEEAKNIQGWDPLTSLPDTWTPYRAVMRCVNQERAELIYRHLLASDCPVESWPDLPAQVTNTPTNHAVANELRRTTILLPVHQTLDTAKVSEAFRRFKTHPAY
ncbi:MAG: hypothetical protein CBB68_06390 [Rhodospirillaceae bacterium TMED8]|nr:hypothetical protein [Magnetovibrio sp.]OUT51246.1 MAG: hypothetical protein CBB68_06390 [Rhodospirillaceae bacterium TMED8]|tara:strand:- start:1421 stop:2572 length:1152 start_codon:yes stop_codon:yes gene_type:complete